MKLPIYKIGILNTAIAQIGELKFPVKTAWEIYKIANELADKIKFISGEEKKIIDKFGGEQIDDGNIKFKDDASTKSAVEELNRLHEGELDCDFDAVEIEFKDLSDCKIEPRTIAALDGVVTFK